LFAAQHFLGPFGLRPHDEKASLSPPLNDVPLGLQLDSCPPEYLTRLQPLLLIAVQAAKAEEDNQSLLFKGDLVSGLEDGAVIDVGNLLFRLKKLMPFWLMGVRLLDLELQELCQIM
jgi:hypothetical protein